MDANVILPYQNISSFYATKCTGGNRTTGNEYENSQKIFTPLTDSRISIEHYRREYDTLSDCMRCAPKRNTERGIKEYIPMPLETYCMRLRNVFLEHHESGNPLWAYLLPALHSNMWQQETTDVAICGISIALTRWGNPLSLRQ